MRRKRWRMIQWTVTATDLPISPEEVRKHLKLLPDDDEDLVELIRAAREYCENYTGQSYGIEMVEVDVDEGKVIDLPRLPVRSIIEVTSNGETVEPFSVDPAFGVVVLPGAKTNIHIKYSSGAALPMTVRQAMLMLIAHWHSNREAVVVGAIASVEPSIGVKELLNQNKGWWF